MDAALEDPAVDDLLEEARLLSASRPQWEPDAANVDRHAERLLASRASRSATGTSGYDRLSADAKRRVRTIAYMETQFLDDELDFTPLVFSACQVLEGELRRLLESISREAGDRLLRAVHDAPRPHEVIARWLDGSVPTMLGTLQVLLMAWRRTCSHADAGSPPAAFGDAYVGLLATRGFERALGRLRGTRNDAAHAKRLFEAEDFEQVATAVVGCLGFGEWLQRGAADGLAADQGLLHHHLALLGSEPSDTAA